MEYIDENTPAIRSKSCYFCKEIKTRYIKIFEYDHMWLKPFKTDNICYRCYKKVLKYTDKGLIRHEYNY